MSVGYQHIPIGEERTERQFNHHLVFSNIRQKNKLERVSRPASSIR